METEAGPVMPSPFHSYILKAVFAGGGGGGGGGVAQELRARAASRTLPVAVQAAVFTATMLLIMAAFIAVALMKTSGFCKSLDGVCGYCTSGGDTQVHAFQLLNHLFG